jgi:hypothetical protein
MTAPPSDPEIVLREQALESTELRRAQRAFSPAKPGQRPLAPPRTAYGNSTSPGSPPDLGAPICNFQKVPPSPTRHPAGDQNLPRAVRGRSRDDLRTATQRRPWSALISRPGASAGSPRPAGPYPGARRGQASDPSNRSSSVSSRGSSKRSRTCSRPVRPSCSASSRSLSSLNIAVGIPRPSRQAGRRRPQPSGAECRRGVRRPRGPRPEGLRHD